MSNNNQYCVWVFFTDKEPPQRKYIIVKNGIDLPMSDAYRTEIFADHVVEHYKSINAVWLDESTAERLKDIHTDEAAVLAANKLGILKGPPLTYFIDGWNEHKAASQSGVPVVQEDKMEMVEAIFNAGVGSVYGNQVRNFSMWKDEPQAKELISQLFNQSASASEDLETWIKKEAERIYQQLDPQSATVQMYPAVNAILSACKEGWMSGARAMAAHQSAELTQLREWKESAISVTPDMQAIGKLLGVGLGQSVHDKIIPGIKALKERLAAAESALTTLWDEQHPSQEGDTGFVPSQFAAELYNKWQLFQ